MRRQLPLFLVFVCGVFMVFQYFVPHESSEWVYEYLLDWTVIIGIFALAIGIWSLVHVSISKIKRKKQYWQYSYVTLISLFAMMFFGWSGSGESGYYFPSKLVVIDATDSTLSVELGTHISPDSIKVLLKNTKRFIDSVSGGQPISSDSIREQFDDPLLDPLKHTGISTPYLNTNDSLYYAFVRDSSLRKDEESHFAPIKLAVTDSNYSTFAIELGPLVSPDSIEVLLTNTKRSIVPIGDGQPLTSAVVRGHFNDSLLNPLNHTNISNAYINAGDSLYYAFVRDSSFGFYFYTKEGLSNSMFTNFFNSIMIPIQSTMFSLLAFFIASAAYRAFRARNVLSTLLLVAAVIVMLRFTPGPWGEYIAITSSWIMNVPNMAAQRAITIGIGLGMVGTALKVVLGIERGYMGKG